MKQIVYVRPRQLKELVVSIGLNNISVESVQALDRIADALVEKIIKWNNEHQGIFNLSELEQHLRAMWSTLLVERRDETSRKFGIVNDFAVTTRILDSSTAMTVLPTFASELLAQLINNIIIFAGRRVNTEKKVIRMQHIHDVLQAHGGTYPDFLKNEAFRRLQKIVQRYREQQTHGMPAMSLGNVIKLVARSEEAFAQTSAKDLIAFFKAHAQEGEPYMPSPKFKPQPIVAEDDSDEDDGGETLIEFLRNSMIESDGKSSQTRKKGSKNSSERDQKITVASPPNTNGSVDADTIMESSSTQVSNNNNKLNSSKLPDVEFKQAKTSINDTLQFDEFGSLNFDFADSFSSVPPPLDTITLGMSLDDIFDSPVFSDFGSRRPSPSE